MRKALIAFGGVLVLSGCAIGPQGQELLSYIQHLTTNACRFVPAIRTLADIVRDERTGVDDAAELADRICAVVRPQDGGPAQAPAPAAIGGVTIEGFFVR